MKLLCLIGRKMGRNSKLWIFTKKSVIFQEKGDCIVFKLAKNFAPVYVLIVTNIKGRLFNNVQKGNVFEFGTSTLQVARVENRQFLKKNLDILASKKFCRTWNENLWIGFYCSTYVHCLCKKPRHPRKKQCCQSGISKKSHFFKYQYYFI